MKKFFENDLNPYLTLTLIGMLLGGSLSNFFCLNIQD